METITKLPKLPDRPIEGHKGLFGRVLIVGGQATMIGAPVLAGTAALRMGAGLVQIAVPTSILSACLSITPELIGLGLGSGSKSQRELREAADASDAIVIGPGLGQSPAARERLMRLIRLEKPMVLDADALNLLSRQKRWPRSFKASAVLTPHPGEMKRLARLLDVDEVPTDDESRRRGLAASAASAFRQTVVLKGHRTIVTDAARLYINETGDSSLSKAGTGDVLCGILATLLAQGMSRFDAACAAVWIHGTAGARGGAKLGRRCVLATDVISALPEAIRAYERET